MTVLAHFSALGFDVALLRFSPAHEGQLSHPGGAASGAYVIHTPEPWYRRFPSFTRHPK